MIQLLMNHGQLTDEKMLVSVLIQMGIQVNGKLRS